jgi:hypothetical protein
MSTVDERATMTAASQPPKDGLACAPQMLLHKRPGGELIQGK